MEGCRLYCRLYSVEPTVEQVACSLLQGWAVPSSGWLSAAGHSLTIGKMGR